MFVSLVDSFISVSFTHHQHHYSFLLFPIFGSLHQQVIYCFIYLTFFFLRLCSFSVFRNLCDELPVKTTMCLVSSHLYFIWSCTSKKLLTEKFNRVHFHMTLEKVLILWILQVERMLCWKPNLQKQVHKALLVDMVCLTAKSGQTCG